MGELTLDRVLAIAGLVLGIPGVLALALSANQALAVSAGMLAVLFLAFAYYARHWVSALPYTFNEATIELKFPVDERHAILTKTYKIRPNFSHLAQITFKNIAADGKITNIRWNGIPVPPGSILPRLGEYEVKIDFPISPPRGREFVGVLSYEFLDSFPADTEAVRYDVDFPTKSALVTVLLPPNRPCRSAEMRRLEGAGEVPLKGLHVSPDRLRLEMSLKRPPLGTQHLLYWDWGRDPA